MKMHKYLVRVSDWYSDAEEFVEVQTLNRELAAVVAIEKSSIYWGYVADYSVDILSI